MIIIKILDKIINLNIDNEKINLLKTEQNNILKKTIYNYSTEYNRKLVDNYKKIDNEIQMEKKKILCIIGKSGTGKSTLIKYLLEKYPEKFNYTKSFTTRSIRKEDKEDINTHIFVNMEHYKKNKLNKKIIAEYKSPLNYYSYITIELLDDEKINLYAIDPIAFNELSNKYSQVFGVYLYLDENERIKRKKNRDKNDFVDEEKHLDKSLLRGNKFEIIDINKMSVKEISDLLC